MSAAASLAVGVVGLGFGANHARVLSGMEGVRLAAVCDTDPGRRMAGVVSEAVRPYEDYCEMLASEPLDAVVIAVPASTHEAVALAAIEAGCAVLVEKPLAPSLEAGRRIVRAAAAAGVPLMAGHIERFNPALQELARQVRKGEVGRVLEVSARRTGAIRVPPADVNVVHDSALHDIDALRFVLRAEVEEVFATAQSGIVTPIENSILGLLRFEPDAGVAALGNLEVSWLSARRLRDLAVLGEDGLFVLDYADQTLDLYRMPARRPGPVRSWEETRSAGAGESVRIPVEPCEQLIQELAAFVDAARSGRPMPVSGDDALAALAVADALTMSARTGKAVRPERWAIGD